MDGVMEYLAGNKVFAVFAEKFIVKGGDFFLKRSSGSDDLKRTSGLKQVGHRAIPFFLQGGIGEIIGSYVGQLQSASIPPVYGSMTTTLADFG